MNQLERTNDQSNRPPQPQTAGPGPSSLSESRRRATALLAAGDTATNNALSTDSREYLAAVRQAGGQ